MSNNFDQNRKTKSIFEEPILGMKAKTATQAFTAADLWNIHKGFRQKAVRKFL